MSTNYFFPDEQVEQYRNEGFVVVARLFVWRGGRGPWTGHRGPDARTILAERYARGEISLRRGSDSHELQRLLLEAEGIRFDERGRIDLKQFRMQNAKCRMQKRS